RIGYAHVISTEDIYGQLGSNKVRTVLLYENVQSWEFSVLIELEMRKSKDFII
ncbi:2499_t:CDS:1, partial [Rhizophagus irregularis]